MNKEEKEAIKELIDSSNLSLIGDGTMIVKNTTIATILNYIDKLEKENKAVTYNFEKTVDKLETAEKVIDKMAKHIKDFDVNLYTGEDMWRDTEQIKEYFYKKVEEENE